MAAVLAVSTLALATWRIILSFSLDTNAFPFVKSMKLVIAANGYGVTGITGLALFDVDGKVEGSMGNVLGMLQAIICSYTCFRMIVHSEGPSTSSTAFNLLLNASNELP